MTLQKSYKNSNFFSLHQKRPLNFFFDSDNMTNTFCQSKLLINTFSLDFNKLNKVLVILVLWLNLHFYLYFQEMWLNNRSKKLGCDLIIHHTSWGAVAVVTSPPLNQQVGCSRPTMFRARCLRVRQHYPAKKKNQKIARSSSTREQQRLAVMSCTDRIFVLRG